MLQHARAPREVIGSYWESSVEQPRLDRQLMGNALFDVAVIGAGYAGLSAALKLAGSGVSVCVLEAEHVGYGASGRNGGFCCLGGTTLDQHQLIGKFGLDEARRFLAYQVAGINLVAQRLDAWGVDVAITGSQKGLRTPPGLGVGFFNKKAAQTRAAMERVSPYWDWVPRVNPEELYLYVAGTAPTGSP